ncbi:6-phosphogluconate dehydrogenase C-terminal domain-like protein [Serendipita vermifera]|nr:6-phosphogluconate dehydrogenase C-terminal domain-like protein [Serendipita vermifera]
MSTLSTDGFSEQKPAQVLIVGFGAVGVIYGYFLEKSKLAQVTAIARSTYNGINERGIDIRSQKWGQITGWKPSRIAKTIEEVLDTAFDLVIISTKSVPEVMTTAQLLEPLLSSRYQHPQPTYVFLQNGLGVEKDVYASLKERNLTATLISCALYIMTNITASFDVSHGTFDRILVGIYKPDGEDTPLTSKEEQDMNRLVRLVKDSGSDAEVAPNIAAAKFGKNLWNASFGMVCSLTGLTPQEWNCTKESGETGMQLISDCLNEMMVVARALGYGEDLVPSSMPQGIIEQAKLVMVQQSDFVPSALLDVRLGKPIELEVILGEVVRKAKKLDIRMPHLEIVYRMLTIVQANLLHKSRA